MISRKVDDGIAASDLLKELTGAPEQRPAQVLRRSGREDIAGLEVARHRLDRLEDNALVQLSLLRIDRRVRERRHDALTFSFVSRGQKPARRLGQGRDSDEEEDYKYHLQTNRQAPR